MCILSLIIVTSAEQAEAERKRKEPPGKHNLAGSDQSRQQLEQLYEKHHRETFRKALVDILLYVPPFYWYVNLSSRLPLAFSSIILLINYYLVKKNQKRLQ